MKPEESLLYLQKATSGTYSEPDATGPATKTKRLFHEISL